MGEDFKIQFDEKKDNNKIPWYMSLPILTLLFVIFVPFSTIIGIILLLKRFGLTKDMPLKRRATKRFTLSIFAIIFGLLGLGFYTDYQSEKPIKEIKKFIAIEDYGSAKAVIDDQLAKENTNPQFYLVYADYYEAQQEYDSATNVLVEYFNKKENKAVINVDVEEKLQELSEKVSDSVKEDIDNVFITIAEAKSQEEAKKVEEEGSATEVKIEKDAEVAQEERLIAEAKEEAKKAEEERLIAEAKKAEEERLIAEAKKAEEERLIAEAKKQQEAENISMDKNDSNNIVTSESIYIDFKEDSSLSLGYALYYADINSKYLHTFSGRDKILKILEDVGNEEKQHFANLNLELFKPNYYSITNEFTDLLYIGDLKDNKPHGQGMLARVYSGDYPLEEEQAFALVYIGNFKNGLFDGYGMEFHAPKNLSSTESLFLWYESEDSCQDTVDKYINTLIYEGDFDKGKWSGKGNYFSRLDMELVDLYTNADTDIILRMAESRNIEIYSGIFKNGTTNGKVVCLKDGYVLYEGEMKDFKYHGKGKLYFPNNTQLEYEGEFSGNEYDGKGTLYNENGEIIYSGKWKNGDYAH